MPMLEGFERVRAEVAERIIGSGFALLRLEELQDDWHWLNWLHRSVDSSDLIVAEVTDNNAFVLYELGIARPRRLPTVLLLRHENPLITAALDGSPYLTYQSDQLELFGQRLAQNLDELAAIRERSSWESSRAAGLFQRANELLLQMRDATGAELPAVEEDVFTLRLGHSFLHGTFVPQPIESAASKAALLSALVRTSRSTDVMARIRDWVHSS
jgi:hypothetical protein